ncbi:alpha/beta hydrolase [Lederbergia sp. NSJ-179]|uniref:alpha/beta fold hydrolase n=1 Tax=Lederbergia sp. NSJ-179 TaxID=2931402 RepID=UPI001FD08B2D|nr:alpha/beta fold hydrolase [Lederbergia sp. NSJ-179]MCJ7842721.1 alpha/beta hydrolase [Lederbergia sp. NSJ-179]
MKNKYSGLGLFFIVILIIGLFISRPKLIDDSGHVAASPAVVPTLFLHGYKGSARSFSTMLERMDEQQWGSKTLVCFVNKRGSVSFKGSIPENVENPFIQVIFEHNRANLSDQTKWVQKVMKQLKKRYHIQEVNLVGHSMGGLALTNYLQTVADDQLFPKAVKFVTIGSPFMGIDRENYFEENYGDALTDLRPNSAALRRLIENKSSFPRDIAVLSIAGVVNHPLAGDGLVSLASALGNQNVFNSEQLTEKVITNSAATHSGLHEMGEVDELIAEFLWEDLGAK